MKYYTFPQSQRYNNVVFSAFDYDYHSYECENAHFQQNYELLICEKGEVDVFIDGVDYVIKADESVLILPFQAHKFVIRDGAYVHCYTFSRHLVMAFDGYMIGKRAQNPVFKMDKKIENVIINELRRIFGDRTAIEGFDLDWQEIAIKGLCYHASSQFLQNVTLVDEPVKDTDISIIAMRYIFENYKKDISLMDVAQKYGYNYQYLSRTFNKTFKTNFKKMLNYYRLEQAIAFLDETDMSISQIAFESGFQSIRSLNAVCLETYGKSPSEVKKERKERLEQWKIIKERKIKESKERDAKAGRIDK